MRNAILKVSLFMCALLALSTQQVKAASLSDQLASLDINNPLQTKLAAEKAGNEPAKKVDAEEKKETPAEKPAPKKEPVQHTVASGETLTAIATQYSLEWPRLFDKNAQIADPNIISVGDVITIPEADEQLASRPLPTPPPVVSAPVSTYSGNTGTVARSAPAPRVASSAGNTYTPGYCTWYVKNRRPDLPNRMGNAISWVSSAAAMGLATGSTPQAGAVGQQGNHVVYVESVNGDGTVTVSDMNYAGLYVITTRTVPASSFQYIY